MKYTLTKSGFLMRPGEVKPRWMIRRDMPSIMRIERESFSDPRSDEDYLRLLRERNTIGMVVECKKNEDDVMGYMIYELRHDSLHLLTFAVRQGDRRIGVGSAMVEKLKSKLSSHRRQRLTLETREPNAASHAFWLSQGFRVTGPAHGGYAMGFVLDDPRVAPSPYADPVLEYLPGYAQWDWLIEKGWSKG